MGDEKNSIKAATGSPVLDTQQFTKKMGGNDALMDSSPLAAT